VKFQKSFNYRYICTVVLSYSHLGKSRKSKVWHCRVVFLQACCSCCQQTNRIKALKGR